MPLDLVGGPAEAFLFVVIAAFALFYFPCLLFELREAASKLVALVEELPHLGEKYHVSQVQSAELVIIAEICITLLARHISRYFKTPKHPHPLIPFTFTQQYHTTTSENTGWSITSAREGRFDGLTDSILRTNSTSYWSKFFSFAS